MPPTTVATAPVSNPILPAPNEAIWALIPINVLLVVFALGVLAGWAMRRPPQPSAG